MRKVYMYITSVLRGIFNKLIIKINNRNFKIENGIRIYKRAELRLYKNSQGKIGKKIKIDCGTLLACVNNARLEIGENVGIGINNVIVARKRVVIGNNTILGPNVMIYDHDHQFNQSLGVSRSEYKCEEVIIGENCWIGANTVILKGTVIGNNCVIGAGSVIKGNYKSNSRIIQKRNTIIE